MPHQHTAAARFVAVGVANTGLLLVLYVLFRVVLPALAANVLATALTTVTGTNANGRLTLPSTARFALVRTWVFGTHP